MFYQPEFALLHLSALVVGGLLLILGLRFPRVARAAFALLFAWACVVNGYTAWTRPHVYLDYGPLALSTTYARFIASTFAEHITAIVGCIATCQGLIAVAIVLGGKLGRIATLGAVIFLLAIAPLGVGSAFPSTLLMSAGALATLRGSSLDAPLWRARRTAHEAQGEQASIAAFLALPRVALVGASSRTEHFSRMVMRALLAHGMDVVPVNPHAASIEGRLTFSRLADVTPAVAGALIMLPAAQAAQAVEACAAAGIEHIWLHRGAGQGSVSPEAVAAAERLHLRVVVGRCPMMFLPEQSAAVHRIHAGVLHLLRQYPKA